MSSTERAVALPAACLNCEQPLGQPRPRYCPACGQETNLRAPRIGEYLQQFGGAYFATEGALWRTVRLLLFKPGELSRQYLAGRRKHYVLPMRLFLSCSVIMLLVLRLAGTVNFAAVEDPEVAQALPDRPDSVVLELGVGSAGLREGAFFCDGPPPWMCQRLKKRLDVDTRTLVQQMHSVNDRVMGNAGLIMIALIPVLALGLLALYPRRDLHYTEHLVVALHLSAFWCLVVAGMQIESDIVIGAGLFVLPLYTVVSMRRVYGGRLWPLLLRAALLMSAYVAVLVSTTIAVTLLALLL